MKCEKLVIFRAGDYNGLHRLGRLYPRLNRHEMT